MPYLTLWPGPPVRKFCPDSISHLSYPSTSLSQRHLPARPWNLCPRPSLRSVAADFALLPLSGHQTGKNCNVLVEQAQATTHDITLGDFSSWLIRARGARPLTTILRTHMLCIIRIYHDGSRPRIPANGFHGRRVLELIELSAVAPMHSFQLWIRRS